MSPQRPTSQTSPSVPELIRGWKWIAYVPAEGQAWLAERPTLTQMPQGRVVYVAGDAASAIYGVVSGAFRIYLTSARGDEVTLEEGLAKTIGYFRTIVSQ